MRITAVQMLMALLVAPALALLAGCDNATDSRTAGQKLDAAVAKTEKTIDGLKAEAKSAGQEAKASASKISEKVDAAAHDAAITAKVKTEIARDASLNALKINVDTTAGRVELKGSASDLAARERAAAIAKGVEDVVSVDNQLVVDAS